MQSLLEGARDCALRRHPRFVEGRRLPSGFRSGGPSRPRRGHSRNLAGSIRRTAGGEHPGNGHQIRPVRPLPAVSECKMVADAGRRRARRRRRAPCRHPPEYFQHRGDPCLSDGNRRASDTRIRRHRSHDGLNLREPGRESIRCPGRWNVQQLGRVSHSTGPAQHFSLTWWNWGPHRTTSRWLRRRCHRSKGHSIPCSVSLLSSAAQLRCSVPLLSSIDTPGTSRGFG